LQRHFAPNFQKLATGWQEWLDYVASTAAEIFYIGKGRVCAVTAIGDQSLPVWHSNQTYDCESEFYLDDPYEGETFTYFLEFFGKMPKKDKHKLWEYKRAKLEKAEYNQGGIGPITVRKGTCSRPLFSVIAKV